MGYQRIMVPTSGSAYVSAVDLPWERLWGVS